AGPRLATWWQKLDAQLSAVEASTATIQLLTADRVAASHAFVEVEMSGLTTSTTSRRSWAVAADGKVILPAVPNVACVVVAWSETSAPFVTTTMLAQLPSRLELARGVAVTGRVVDAKRKAIESAAIETVFKLDGLPRGIRRRVRSSSNGRFTASGLPRGAIQLTVKQTGRATVLRRVEPKDDLDLGDIILMPSREAVVRLIDVERKPIANATLRTADGVSATSNRDGVARLVSVPESFSVNVKAKGFRAKDVEIEGNDPVVVELSRGVRVTGSVVDAETGEPANGGNVLVLNNGGRRVMTFDGATIDL